MKINTNPVRGMKDFLPDEAELRERVKRAIIDTYTSFGYRKIETPALEHLELLTGGDGGENEKLIFKVLKRGEKLDITSIKEEKDLSEEGLRFDLTVPLTRIYANNQGNIPLPFKVIQTDYVFRAERPQKGRYRQFMQCDIDIIGEESYVAEIDILYTMVNALMNIGLGDFTIKINDRQILNIIADKCGFSQEEYSDIFIIIDKLDKIGLDKVKQELLEKEYSTNKITKVIKFLEDIQNQLPIDIIFNQLDINNKAVENVYKIIESVKELRQYTFQQYKLNFDIEFDPTLVRGMGYYTGTIFEVKYKDYSGSIGGGGRYDKMIGKRIGRDVPACGFSIGFERIIEIIKGSEKNYTVKKKLAVIYEIENFDLPKVIEFADNIIKVSKSITEIVDNTIMAYEFSIGEINDFMKIKNNFESFENNYRDALRVRKCNDPYYNLISVNIVKKEKNTGKQLKKLFEQGYTYFINYNSHYSFEIRELKAGNNETER